MKLSNFCVLHFVKEVTSQALRMFTFLTFFVLGISIFLNNLVDAQTVQHRWQIEHKWAKRFGGATHFDYGKLMVKDSNGRLIVSGIIGGKADLNGDGDSSDGGAESSTGYGSVDVFIGVFDSSGDSQWSKRLGGLGLDGGYSVAVDENCNVIVSGWVTGSVDLNGDGDSLDGGAENSVGYGGRDAFISVFSSNGTHLWAKRIGGAGTDLAFSVTVDSSSNIITAGYIDGNADLNGDGDSSDGGAESSTGYGGTDIFISSFTSSGAFLWSKRLGGSGYDEARYVTTDKADNVLVTGRVNNNADLNGDGDSVDGGAEDSASHGLDDIFISVFDSAGNYKLARRFGGSSLDWGDSLVVDEVGNVIFTGFVEGNADLNGDGDATDGGAESGSGYAGYDIVVSVFDSDGVYQWSKRLGGLGLDFTFQVIIDGDGNVLLVGRVEGNADLNGDGDSVDGGAEDATGFGDKDIIISVFDIDGNHIWAKRLGGIGADNGYSIVTSLNGDVFMTGYATGNVDLNGDGDSTDGGAEDSTGYGLADIFISVFSVIYDTSAPLITLNNTSSTNDPIITGIATDNMGTVANVEYQIDTTSGNWSSCVANDGVFDGASESFTCNVGILQNGSHMIFIRSSDDINITTVSGDEVLFNIIYSINNQLTISGTITDGDKSN